jgi:ATP-dependent Lon protease
MPKKKSPMHPDPRVWIRDQGVRTTADVEVPQRLIDQVIGQERAVAVAQKAAEQKRHLLLIGDPGTGKSMLAKAMTEILPAEKQSDILVYHNAKNPNNPKAHTVAGGQARSLVQRHEKKARRTVVAWMVMEWTIAIAAIAFGLWLWIGLRQGSLPFLFLLLIALLFLYFASQKRPKSDFLVPKLLLEHTAEAERAPYVDGTGAHAGALLGDVRHDPYQSGGLETPPHVRVEAGAIHRAHGGVLFIDEINVLRLESQQALLTALQEKKYSIVGQSQSSSGAMIKTDPIPCDVILVAAGNLDAVAPPLPGQATGMHPALRSRIRGYGYEVFVNSVMADTEENRRKLVQFVAQEVVRDGKIPHFDAEAVAEVLREAQRRAGETGKLTLRLRELGGLVRTAGDIAREESADVVRRAHVRAAKEISRSLEQQITDTDIQRTRSREAAETRGAVIGTAKGLALVGTGDVGEPAGLVVPVEAAVVPALSRSGGTIVVGHGLKDGAGSAVENVGAVLKVLKGAAIADHDIHVDAITRVAHAETEGIGAAVAVAAISALESLPIKQGYAMTGTLTVTGDLRPVRGIVQRIEAAAAVGYPRVIVPEASRPDVLLDPEVLAQIEVVYARNLAEVLRRVVDAPPAHVEGLTVRLMAHGAANGRNGAHPEEHVVPHVVRAARRRA